MAQGARVAAGTRIAAGTRRSLSQIGLMNHWSMEEAGPGTRFGLDGRYALTDFTNGIARTTGKVGFGALLVAASSQWFWLRSKAPLNFGRTSNGTSASELTVSAWVNANSLATGISRNCIAAHQGNPRGWHLDYNAATSSFEWSVSVDGSTDLVVDSSAISIVTGTWYHVVGVVDLVLQRLVLYVNNNQFIGANPITSMFIPATGVIAQVGARGANVSAVGSGSFWDGILDEITLSSRAWTSDDVNYVYNSGNGRAFPW